MATVQDVIEAFRAAPSNAERGILFEQLMVRYFELDPTLSQQYDAVWRWSDWPGRDGKTDTGIDLVARERGTGDLTAIQAKFYEPTTTLTKGHIDSFFTASGKHPFTNRIIISTTDRWGSNAEEAIADQQIPVQRIGLPEIAESPIDWDIAWPMPSELPRVTLTQAPRHELRRHQSEAIEAVFDGFAAGHDRGKLIMACGTGKTFTALKIAERTAAENGGSARVVFAVPSISLLAQTLREWTAQTRLDLRAFAVCSDTKVSRAAEDISTVDVAIPVTTDPVRLAAQMRRGRRAAGLTVVFTTYQSLPVVAEAQRLQRAPSVGPVDPAAGEPFDLIICDEAHRTTGVTLEGADESNFVRVHDEDYLRATRRLYMTATPRIFDENTHAKAQEASAVLTSMDDEAVFGPEFHRLSFGEAVERGLLTDYKVLVLTVDEDMVAAPLQAQLAAGYGELRLDDASRVVGCWNGLAKRAGATATGQSFAPEEVPMRRAVAFARDIASSRQVAETFPAIVDAYRDLLQESADEGHEVSDTNFDLGCEVRHVDGTFNALERGRELAWLKAPVAQNECRILTNARCLSEGVDVPALDAVLFLHPRNSVVDVVQSVGRVMRKSPGKDYGYIILPVAVPAGVAPEKALADNVRFKVVWQVLNALRAHDERFNAMVNSINLNATNPDPVAAARGGEGLLGGHIGPTSEAPESLAEERAGGEAAPAVAADADAGLAKQMALFSLAQWREAIYARIVAKVGTRTYWEDWAGDVADIAAALISRIHATLDAAGAGPGSAGEPGGVAGEFEAFVAGLRDNLNDSITWADAVSMLAQHLITRPVFEALFAGHAFAEHNPVSRAMERMVATLGQAGLEAETARLEGFYASVRTRASEVSSAAGKQQVIAELYEKFFKLGFRRQTEALGIVYTPVEVVDFILRAADDASRAAFGRGLTDEGVHILDPFTGTGTFLTRLLQSGLIAPGDLARKYGSELHANEIMLLAYYIAAVNIETTYHSLREEVRKNSDPSEHALRPAETADGTGSAGAASGGYEPFEGIVLADTFQITEEGDTFDEVMFPANNERITRQLATPINVIVGNPPYSVGQTSANDLNANIAYPTLDARIAGTYAKRSTATNKNSLYDSYLRAFRWATDRIGEQGIVAFVSNGGWIDGNTADGIRLTLADEYSTLYVYNLRGNARTAGDLRRKEAGNVFGGGARTTVAILIGVKDPDHTGPCRIHYRDIGDYLTREEKLTRLEADRIARIDWQQITPNSHGDWIGQRSDEFSTWPVVATKKPDPGQVTVFKVLSSGLKTGRDAWCYASSRAELERNVTTMLDQYETVRRAFQRYAAERGVTRPKEADVTAYLTAHPEHTGTARMSWNRSIKQHVARDTRIEWDDSFVFHSTYRPYTQQWAYFDRRVNDMVYRLTSIFPTPHHDNVGIYQVGDGSAVPFSVLMTDRLPDLHVTGAGSGGQFFPRWTYEPTSPVEGQLDLTAADGPGEVDEWGYRRVDNITDEIQALYTAEIGDGEPVSKDDIFHYVYGLLHDPAYRQSYAADLRKMLPHIPTPTTRERFDRIATAGARLAGLHLGYESVEPWPVDVVLKPGIDPEDRETWRVRKPRWAKTKDPATGKNTDDHTTIVYNSHVSITGIPPEAGEYLLGSRSALGWILDRYQVKTDKASGITNDPNDWADEHGDPRYIVDLIAKVTRVAVETVRIVHGIGR